jgi:hypothetical protein
MASVRNQGAWGKRSVENLPSFSSTDLATDFAKGLPRGKTEALDPGSGRQSDAIRLSLHAGGFTTDKYPALYRSLQAGGAAGTAPDDRLMLVDAGRTADGKATATVWTSVDGPSAISGGVTLAFDPASGALLASGANTALSNGFLTSPTRAAHAKALPGDRLSLLHLGFATDLKGQSRFFAMADDAAAGNGIQANVTQPVITKQGHTLVEISVGRVSGNANNDCDYVYFNPQSIGNQDNPNLVCPFVGNVALAGAPNLSAVTATNLLTNIVMNNGQNGNKTIDRATQYTTDSKLIAGLAIGSAPNILTWSYPFDGPNTYYANTVSLVYNTTSLGSELTSYFYYMFNIPMQGGLPNQVFFVCSKDSPEVHSVNCTKIDNLLFWWHCVVKGTPVTLENGERLAIELVTNAHRVRSADGRVWAVRATRHGRHASKADATGVEAVYRIETDSGHGLTGTGDHLIALADGSFRQLADIAVGDAVASEKGAARVTGHAAIDYEGACYNLALGDDDDLASGRFPTDAAVYYAGGIASGDHMALRAYVRGLQNDLGALLAGADPALHADVRSAFADRRF